MTDLIILGGIFVVVSVLGFVLYLIGSDMRRKR